MPGDSTGATTIACHVPDHESEVVAEYDGKRRYECECGRSWVEVEVES